MKPFLTSLLLVLASVSIVSAMTLHGVLGEVRRVSQPFLLPTCTVFAEDVFSFRTVESCGIGCFFYDNDSPAHKGISGFSCTLDGLGGFVKCPTLLPNGGPDGLGGLYIFSDEGGNWNAVGLDMDDKAWQDYSIANELSVSFHFKARRGPSPLLFGNQQSPILWKPGEIWLGSDNSPNHADRVCINVDGVVDKGGATGTGAQYCGTDAEATNNGLGATTGANSTPVDTWVHIAEVWDGPNGTYRVYLDGTLVHTETGITGTIPSTTGRWTIGVGASSDAFTAYEIANLHIDDTAWDLARVLASDCNIPD